MVKPKKILVGAALASTGCDWLTLTAKRNTETARLLHDIATNHIADHVEKGSDLKPGKPQGFKGEGVDGCFFGSDRERIMLRASGESAVTLLAQLKENDVRAKCTRFDAQQTFQERSDNRGTPKAVRDTVRRYSGRLVGSRKAETTFIEADNGGDSVSCGSRASARYYRCYNKTLEQRSKVAPNLTRFEVEFKGALSSQMYAAALDSPNVEEMLCNVVMVEWAKQGVPLPRAAKVGEYPALTSYRQTDTERRKQWLGNVGRSVCEKLQQDGVSREELLALLGLDAASLAPSRSDHLLELRERINALREAA